MNGGEVRDVIAAICHSDGDAFEAWLIGGASLVVAGIQEATKDVDLVFDDERSRSAFVVKATQNGFAALKDPIDSGETTGHDRAVTLLGADNTIIDCFLRVTTHFTVSEGMRGRSVSFIDLDQCYVQRVVPQDIFVLKSATGRRSDARFARDIVTRVDMDWMTVLDALDEQEALGNLRTTCDIAFLLTEARLWASVPSNVVTNLLNRVRMSGDRLQDAATASRSIS